jgi:hypothetical protein
MDSAALTTRERSTLKVKGKSRAKGVQPGLDDDERRRMGERIAEYNRKVRKVRGMKVNCGFSRSIAGLRNTMAAVECVARLLK